MRRELVSELQQASACSCVAACSRVSITRKRQSNSYGRVAEMSVRGARTRATDVSNDPAEKERANILRKRTCEPMYVHTCE